MVAMEVPLMSSIVCSCKDCIHNDHNMRACTLKVVFIDADGTCGDKEEGESTEKTPSTDDGDIIEQ